MKLLSYIFIFKLIAHSNIFIYLLLFMVAEPFHGKLCTTLYECAVSEIQQFKQPSQYAQNVVLTL